MRRDYDLASKFDQEDFTVYMINVICKLESSYVHQFEEACLATNETAMNLIYRQFLTSPCSAECKSVLACSILSWGMNSSTVFNLCS